MTFPYKSLLDHCPTKLAEAPHRYLTVSEQHIQAVWLEQKYFRDLKSLDGLPVTVLSPGMWNAEAGPDFKKAHLRIGEEELRGDIEIHLSQEGWTNHHHDGDPNYQDVIFHLFLWKPKRVRSCMTNHGKEIPQASLFDYLTIPIGRILSLIDLDLYPYKRFSETGKCASSLFRNLSVEDSKELFLSAALWRLDQKANYLSKMRASEQLTIGIVQALGYKNNSKEFIKLFEKLNELKHLSERELFLHALSMCGFFNKKFQSKWEKSPYYQKLLSESLSLLSPNSPTPCNLTLHMIRPFNHPIRRIFYLVKFITSPSRLEIYEKGLKTWDTSWEKLLAGSIKSKQLFSQLCELIPDFQDSYWNSHFLFEEKENSQFLHLIGQSLREVILINAFFPLLYRSIISKGTEMELKVFLDFYSSLPTLNTSKTRYLTHRFFGQSSKQTLLKKAALDQGAIQVHRDFCMKYELSCEGCPFVERSKKYFKQRIQT